MQRDRAFTSYDDLNARFETRPSLWIEPRGNWGEGYVELIEIPSEEEIHDNIVAYWTPSVPLERGTPFPVSYRLTWSDGAPIPPAASSVVRTAVGRLRKDNQYRFLVDFEGPALAGIAETPTADLSVSTGQVLRTSVQPHPLIGGVRVSFDFDTGGAEMSEMRLALKRGDTFISETWLYRWTA
jgi:glucans biosynthesis protein